MNKRIIPLMILFLGSVGSFFIFPTQEVAAYPNNIFFEDFEEDVFPRWNATGLWHLEDNDTSLFPLDKDEGIPSPSHYMWFGDNATGMYDDDEGDGYLTSPIIDLSSHTGIVEFTFASYKNTTFDHARVQYTNDGTTWRTIWSGVANNIIFAGTSEGPVAEIKSKSSTFQLRFCFIMDEYDYLPIAGFFGWRIDNVKLAERPSFNIVTTKNLYTNPGEALNFYFTIFTYFSSSHYAQIVVNITTPLGNNDTIYYNNKTFVANERWDFKAPDVGQYTCNQRGEYQLAITIIDELGQHHSENATCYSGDYIGINSYSESGYVFPGDIMELNCDLGSYYESDVSVDIIVKVTVNNINYTTIYNETDILLNPFTGLPETQYSFTVKHTSTETGRHSFHIEVTDENGKHFVWVEFIEVGPYFDIYYKSEQYSVPIGDFISFDIYMDPYLFEDIEVNMSITVKTPSGGTIILYEESNQPFSPSGLLSETWIKSFSYQSLEPGYHDVETKVINASNPSDFWYGSGSSGWQAMEADPKLTITQTNKYPNLDDTEYINFTVQSRYAFNIVVDISIIMTTPSGNEEELHKETSTDLLAIGHWDLSISYTFDDYGKYDVEFLVVDNSDGTEWVADSWWRVSDEDESTSETSFLETGDTSPLVSPGLDIFTGLLTLAATAFCLHKQRRRKK